jgi:PAS domain S-box-containing protein
MSLKTPDGLPAPEAEAQRAAFLEAMDPRRNIRELFEHLPGIAFFMKNRRSILMGANRSFLERFGFSREEEIIGKSDFDLFPDKMAEHFRADDRAVMQSDKAKINLVELFPNRQGIPDWFITNKLPVHARDGSVLGVMGTVQNYELKRRIEQPYPEIARAVDHIRAHLSEPLQVKKLARMASLSVRQFDRKFKETFNITPKSFIIKTRVQQACELLRKGDATLSDVACDLGFYDQSSFTLHFRNEMGLTPLRYQKQFRLTGGA